MDSLALPLCWIFAILDLGATIFLIGFSVKKKSPIAGCMAAIGFGLFYDALICSLSGTLPLSAIETNGFKIVSLFRYILHGALIPLLFTICAQALHLKKVWQIVGIALTIVVSILGILQGCFTDLELLEVAHITRYVSSENTPRWANSLNRVITIFPMIPLLATGIAVVIKEKKPWLLLSGALMFLFAALGGAVPAFRNYNFVISMIGEVFMLGFFVVYVITEKNEPKAAKPVKEN